MKGLRVGLPVYQAPKYLIFIEQRLNSLRIGVVGPIT